MGCACLFFNCARAPHFYKKHKAAGGATIVHSSLLTEPQIHEKPFRRRWQRHRPWPDSRHCRDAAGTRPRIQPFVDGALAARHVRRVLDRFAVLLQCGADSGPGGRCGRQGRSRWRRYHQIRRAARAAVVSLVGARHLADGLGLHRIDPQLRRIRLRAGRRDRQSVPACHRHRRLARHHHAVQCLGADLAESEKGAGHRAGHR